MHEKFRGRKVEIHFFAKNSRKLKKFSTEGGWKSIYATVLVARIFYDRDVWTFEEREFDFFSYCQFLDSIWTPLNLIVSMSQDHFVVLKWNFLIFYSTEAFFVEVERLFTKHRQLSSPTPQFWHSTSLLTSFAKFSSLFITIPMVIILIISQKRRQWQNRKKRAFPKLHVITFCVFAFTFFTLTILKFSLIHLRTWNLIHLFSVLCCLMCLKKCKKSFILYHQKQRKIGSFWRWCQMFRVITDLKRLKIKLEHRSEKNFGISRTKVEEKGNIIYVQPLKKA